MKHFSIQQFCKTVILAAGNKYLSACNAVEHKFLTTGIQFTEYIIQQENRIFSRGIF
jgi:hypothetical protein